jgi:AraC-like DNA-binding protein
MTTPSCRLLTLWREEIAEWWDFRLNNPYWRLYLNADCGAALRLPGGVLPLRPGRPVLVPPNCDVRGQCRGRVRHTYLHVEVLGWDAAWVARAFPAPLPVAMSPALGELQRVLTQRNPTPGDGLAALSIFTAALAEAFRALPPEVALEAAEADVLGPAVRRVEGFLSGPLHVADLARRCGLGEDAFRARIQARFGCPPAHWVQRCRVAAATERLSHTAEAIDEVAAACGFANRFHFSRVFRRIQGVAPATWRHLQREASPAPARS